MTKDPSEPPDWAHMPTPDYEVEDAGDDRLDDLEDLENAPPLAAELSLERAAAVPANSTPTVPIYDVTSTSLQSADGKSLPLTLRPDDDASTTRRILSWQIVDNAKNPKASLHIKIHHQRRATTKSAWLDASSYNPGKLKADEEVSLDLHADEVLQLFDQMTKLYALSSQGVPSGTRSFHVVDRASGVAVITGQEGEVLKGLIEKHGNQNVIDLLRSLAPDPFVAAGLVAIHEQRKEALEIFRTEVKAERWSENDWYKFFDANQWIFGHGLAYQFLNKLQGQAYVGGQGLDGKGGKRPDYFFETAGDVRFTVVVEIKKPETRLLEDKATYRPGVYNLGDELTGGIAQVQATATNGPKKATAQGPTRISRR